jgi:hypothetical protein
MLKRQDIIREYLKAVDELGIKPQDMVVGAGGACVLHGVREQTEDIDTDVPEELFYKLLDSGKYKWYYFTSGTSKVIVLEYNQVIDIHRLEHGIQSTMVDGVNCYSVEQVLKQKQALNRLKDQADIIALQQLLTN